MRKDSRHSLHRRLLWRLAVPLVLVGLATAIASYRTALAEANGAHDRTLLASARAIAERVEMVKGHVAVDVPYVALDTFQVDTRGRIYYRVLDPAGHFVSGDRDLPPLPAGVPRSNDYPALVHFYDTVYLGTPLRMAALWQPVADGETAGMALVQVGETLEMRDDMALRLLTTTLWQQALLIAASMGLIALAVGAALRPLRQLEVNLRTRDSASLEPIGDARLPREIHPLVASLNGYLQRLRVVISRQTQFLDDASHQLRTSLTLLRARADHAARAHPAMHEWRDIRAAIDRTVRLTNQLLSLARTNAAPDDRAASGTVIELGALCRAVCAEWFIAARRAGLDLGVNSSGQARACVAGDEALLREMLVNLIENALHYTAPLGGSVTVSVCPGQQRHTILVDDTGPGIPPALRPRAFDRFARLDRSHPGSGLGLSIVLQICEMHGGTVALQDNPEGKGLRVRVELPGSCNAATI